MATATPTAINPNMTPAEWDALYQSYYDTLQTSKVKELTRVRKDLITWRRGSAQLVLKVNPVLNNFSIYSVLVTDVNPTVDLYRWLLSYNSLQRRESLGLIDRNNQHYIVLKYTMELELATIPVVQRHVFALQEIADNLDTELAQQFGGKLHFEDWNKMDQKSVDSLMENLFG
ncbi:MAG TPA: hypothetical protein VF678_06570 [bacterium]